MLFWPLPGLTVLGFWFGGLARAQVNVLTCPSNLATASDRVLASACSSLRSRISFDIATGATQVTAGVVLSYPPSTQSGSASSQTSRLRGSENGQPGTTTASLLFSASATRATTGTEGADETRATGAAVVPDASDNAASSSSVNLSSISQTQRLGSSDSTQLTTVVTSVPDGTATVISTIGQAMPFNSQSPTSRRTSKGVIIGAVVGSVLGFIAIVVLIVLALVLLRRRRRRRTTAVSSDVQADAASLAPHAPFNEEKNVSNPFADTNSANHGMTDIDRAALASESSLAAGPVTYNAAANNTAFRDLDGDNNIQRETFPTETLGSISHAAQVDGVRNATIAEDLGYATGSRDEGSLRTSSPARSNRTSAKSVRSLRAGRSSRRQSTTSMKSIVSEDPPVLPDLEPVGRLSPLFGSVARRHKTTSPTPNLAEPQSASFDQASETHSPSNLQSDIMERSNSASISEAKTMAKQFGDQDSASGAPPNEQSSKGSSTAQTSPRGQNIHASNDHVNETFSSNHFAHTAESLLQESRPPVQERSTYRPGRPGMTPPLSALDFGDDHQGQTQAIDHAGTKSKVVHPALDHRSHSRQQSNVTAISLPDSVDTDILTAEVGTASSIALPTRSARRTSRSYYYPPANEANAFDFEFGDGTRQPHYQARSEPGTAYQTARHSQEYPLYSQDDNDRNFNSSRTRARSNGTFIFSSPDQNDRYRGLSLVDDNDASLSQGPNDVQTRHSINSVNERSHRRSSITMPRRKPVAGGQAEHFI